MDVQSRTGGWIAFPGGQYTHDPASEVELPGGGGVLGLTHDLALNRWLPVPRQWVAPDGLRYVFPASDNRSITVVNSAGSTRQIGTFATQSASDYWILLTAEPEGVYVRRYPGLQLVGWDGTMRWITQTGFWGAVSGGFAYGREAHAVVRLDLKSGATSEIFSKPDMEIQDISIGAANMPVVVATSGGETEVWLLRSPAVRLISEPEKTDSGLVVGMAMGDSHGTWITMMEADKNGAQVGATGTYLFTPSSGLEMASRTAGAFASSCR